MFFDFFLYNILVFKKGRIKIKRRTTHTMHYPIHFTQEDFSKRLMKVKKAFINSKGQLQKQIKATFYFEEETVIEFPSYSNQWRREILDKVTIQMTMTSDGHLHYSKPNRKRMQSFFTFPLTQVHKIEFKSTEDTTLKKLFSERLDGVWDDLSSVNLKQFTEGFKTISLKDCLYEMDYELFKEALDFKKPFVSYRFNGNLSYRVEIKIDHDGICRAWVTEEDIISETERTYLILNSTTAIWHSRIECFEN